MCALEYDIKKKGENAYYYAHKARFENNNADLNAKAIIDPGIITGSVPVFLYTEQKLVENVKKPKSISSYQFYDDDKFAMFKSNYQKMPMGITKERIKSDFQKSILI